MLKTKILEKLFLFFSFFPFISFYPIDTDVQPLFIVFGILVIFKYFIINQKKINLIYILLFLLFLLLSFKINFSVNDNIFYISKAVSPLIGMITLIAFYYLKDELDGKFFFIIINIYFWVSLFIFINPELFLNIQGYLVRNVNTTDIYGIRGISTFSTEPGLFAGLLICFLIINDYLFNTSKQSLKSYRLNFLFIFIMIILTKSGTGYLLFFVYSFLKLFVKIKLNRKSIFGVLFIIFLIPLFIYLINYLNEIFQVRGLDILVKLIFEPELLLLLDMSILTRVYNFYIGILSISYYPFGYGINNINELVYEIINNSQLLLSFSKFEYVDFSQKISLTSSFATLSVMYGLFWWFLWFLILFFVSKANFVSKIFAMIFISFSFSAAFPLIWILLSLDRRKYNE